MAQTLRPARPAIPPPLLARLRNPAARRLHGGLTRLARLRWASVTLAVLVLAAVLVALAYADAADVVGLPAAVAAAVAGTVAVVFGPRDGALVALCGAAVFVLAEGAGPGQLAALAVWPAIVVAAGLFARRVARYRAALQQLVTAQEEERQRLALELHDETAQTLAGALMTLRMAEYAATPADAAAANAELRELLRQTITRVRALAVDLRPKTLDDFGFAPAVERLAETFSGETGIAVELRVGDGAGGLAPDAQLALYRVVQEALAAAAAHGAGRLTIRFERREEVAAVVVEDERAGLEPTAADGGSPVLAGLGDRLGLIGGRLTITSDGGRATTVRAEVPCAT